MGKRKSTGESSGSLRKYFSKVDVPDVASMTALRVGGGSGKKVAMISEDVSVKGMAYADDEVVYDGELYGSGPLCVLQMGCSAAPNPLFMFLKMLDIFTAITKENKDDAEGSVEEVEMMGQKRKIGELGALNASYQFVSKRTEDQDNVGWVLNRSGFYVPGRVEKVKDVLMYLDEVLAWRAGFSDETFTALAGVPKIVVYAPKELGLAIDADEDEVKCSFELKDASESAMTVFDMPPPVYPARLVVLTFQVVNAETAHCVFGGNTKPFQEGFIRMQIPGQVFRDDPNDRFGQYYRTLKDMKVANVKECLDTLGEIYGEKCLKHSPMIVRKKESKIESVGLRQILAQMDTWENVRVEACA